MGVVCVVARLCVAGLANALPVGKCRKFKVVCEVLTALVSDTLSGRIACLSSWQQLR